MKLSIIVPVYNVEKYIKKCLNSLIKQKIDSYEIIVVNDGSTDNSQKIIDDYVKKYPMIIKSYKKKNGGLSDARNYGIKKSKGKFIAFLDSDDYVEKDMYKTMLKKADEGYDIVVCDINYVYEDGTKELAHSNIFHDLNSFEEIKKSMINIYPAAWNKIYKRELFDKVLFKKNVWFEDVELMYRLYPYLNSIGVVHKPFINYVQREGAITKTFDERLYHEIYNWNGIIEYYKKNNIYNMYREELEFCYVRYIYASFIKQALNYPSYDKFFNAVDCAIKNVHKTFPKYRRNKYFYKNGMKGFYLIIFNKLIAKIMYKLKRR